MDKTDERIIKNYIDAAEEEEEMKIRRKEE